jgi:hypothetical protein
MTGVPRQRQGCTRGSCRGHVTATASGCTRGSCRRHVTATASGCTRGSCRRHVAAAGCARGSCWAWVCARAQGGWGGAPPRVPARRGARGCAGAHGGMRGRAWACGGARGRSGARGGTWGSGGARACGQRRSGAWGERGGVQVSASGTHKCHMGISPQEESSILEGSAHRVRLWAAGALWARGSTSSPPLPGRWGWGVIRSRGRGKLGVAGEGETRAMHWCVECGQSIASKRVYGRKSFLPTLKKSSNRFKARLTSKFHHTTRTTSYSHSASRGPDMLRYV